MGTAAVLFIGAEPFEQIVNMVPCEICWKLIERFQRTWRRRQLKITRFYICIQPRARAGNPRGWGHKILIVSSFTTLIIYFKFQTLVFNIFWDNDFSKFSPYRLQIWPCHAKVKCQSTIIIWIHFVALKLCWFWWRWFLSVLPYMGMAAIF